MENNYNANLERNSFLAFCFDPMTGWQYVIEEFIDDELTRDVFKNHPLAYKHMKIVQIIHLGKTELKIEPGLFEGMETIEVVNMSKVHRADIPANAFKNCRSLKIVNFPDITYDIGISAFENCDIRELEFPIVLQQVWRRAFANNRKLEAVGRRGKTPTTNWDFPVLLKKIGGFAFYGAKKPSSITLYDSINYIGPYAFPVIYESRLMERLRLLFPEREEKF